MADPLLAYDQTVGWGATSGIQTASLKTLDLDNINSAFVDGTALHVEATFVAVSGSNARAMTRRSVFMLSSGQFTEIATDLIESSIGSLALATVATDLAPVSGQNAIEAKVTGITLLDISWMVKLSYIAFLPQ